MAVNEVSPLALSNRKVLQAKTIYRVLRDKVLTQIHLSASFSRVQHYTGFISQALHLGPYLLFFTRKDWPSERRKAFLARKRKPV